MVVCRVCCCGVVFLVGGPTLPVGPWPCNWAVVLRKDGWARLAASRIALPLGHNRCNCCRTVIKALVALSSRGWCRTTAMMTSSFFLQYLHASCPIVAYAVWYVWAVWKTEKHTRAILERRTGDWNQQETVLGHGRPIRCRKAANTCISCPKRAAVTQAVEETVPDLPGLA